MKSAELINRFSFSRSSLKRFLHPQNKPPGVSSKGNCL
jgi:hypothetical protein